MALVIRVGRGNGWRRQGDDGRTERQDSRRELEGSVGTEGRGCACASSQASQSHSRSSTTVPHDPWSDPTTASVYRRHPHSQQPLVSRATPEGSTKLRASSTGFESFCKSWRGGGVELRTRITIHRVKYIVRHVYRVSARWHPRGIICWMRKTRRSHLAATRLRIWFLLLSSTDFLG